MKKTKIDKRVVRGRVWSGLWSDGRAGWFAGPFFDGYKDPAGRPDKYAKPYMRAGDTLVLCEYVLRPVLDKNGRPIIRKAKP